MICSCCLRRLARPPGPSLRSTIHHQPAIRPSHHVPSTLSLRTPHLPFSTHPHRPLPKTILQTQQRRPLLPQPPPPAQNRGFTSTPALSAPRNTMNRFTHLKRKRKHGFLSRIRTRTGRMILKRRRAKGRQNLSHR